MATTIAKLAATISADGTNFTKEMERIGKSSKVMQKALQGEGNKILDGRAAAMQQAAFKQRELDKKVAQEAYRTRVAYAVKAAQMVTALAIEGSKQVIADLKTARKMGESVNGLRTVEQGLRDVNGDTQGAARALGVLAQQIARANTGSISAADAFNRLGVDTASLANAAPSDALRVLADRFQAIKDPVKQAALAQQIFGDEALNILPLLVQGSAGLDTAAKRMKAFGGSVSDVDAANLETVKILWDNLVGSWSMFTNVAVGLLPFIIALTEELSAASGEGMRLGDYFRGAVYLVGTWVATAKELWNGMILFFKLYKIAVLGVMYIIAAAIHNTLVQLAKLPDELGGSKFRQAADEAALHVKVIGDAGREAHDEIDATMANFGKGFQELDGWMAKVLARSDQLGAAANAARGAFGAVNAAFRNMELFRAAGSVVEDVATPLQKYTARMSKLNAMVAAGAISWDVYSRAAAKAVQELEAAHELSNLSMPGAVKANTAEAVSAINQARFREDFRNREKPEDRVRRVLEQSQEIERQQLEYQRRIAEAAANPRVARF